MAKIISAFSTLFTVLVFIYAGAALITAGADVAAANEYKANVVEEIENSNFNPYVVTEGINHAQAAGYQLEVLNTSYDEDNNVNTAQVILTYDYKMPILGIQASHETRGIAR